MWMTQQKGRSLCTVIMPILLMKKLRLREVVHLAPKLEVSLTAKMIFSPLSYTTFIRPSSHYSCLFMSFIIQDNNQLIILREKAQGIILALQIMLNFTVAFQRPSLELQYAPKSGLKNQNLNKAEESRAVPSGNGD